MAETPIRDGALPSQIAVLSAPIAYAACAVHPYHKWVYVGGAIVTMHLNKIFGYDGWDFEILEAKYIAPEMGNPVTSFKSERGRTKGKTMYKAIAQCRVRITIHWPGGRKTFKDGIGTSAVPQPTPEDACDMNAQAAETFALRDAAIKMGAQFGLEVMRLKVEDDRGNQIPWQNFTGDEPKWPVFGGGDGERRTNYESHTNQVGPDAAGHEEVQPTSTGVQTTSRPPAQTQRREPEPEAKPAPAPEPESKPAAESAPEAKPGNGKLAAVPDGFDRTEYTAECRTLWKEAPKGVALQIWKETCADHGVEIAAKMIKHPQAAGGPSDLILTDVTLRLRAAKEG